MFYDSKLATVEQYLRRLSGQEKEPIVVDHNYVKPWSAHPESQRTKPAKMLFMNTVYRKKRVVMHSDDEQIDVVGLDRTMCEPSPFDNHKTKVLANELERSIKCNFDVNRPEISLSEDWTFQQKRIFLLVMKVINAESLAKVVYTGQPHECLKRKIATEKYARQLRTIFANICWDFTLIVWIHKLILDSCSFLSVVSYLNLLQALRTKVPNFVDKVIKAYSGHLGHDYLSQLLKKNSKDPVLPILNQYKIKKLPGNPFLLINSAVNFDRALSESPRFRFWTTQLNSLCKTMHMPVHSDEIDSSPGVLGERERENLQERVFFLEVASLKNKVTEFKNHFPNRPVILGGWTVGSLVACHVALETPVSAVICFGFPLTGVNGSRGELDDPLLRIKVPTLFIVGQNSTMCAIDDIEDFRSRMRAETCLVVIGSADDYLLVSPNKMQQECITQAMVDRAILDEISDFLQSALVKSPSTSSNHLASNNPIKSCHTIIEESTDVPDVEEEGKRKRRRPKEYSPELPSSRKRTKHSVTKEISNVASKSRLSPSSSETSSSGSSKYEKQTIVKIAKKQPEKRGVGRPPSSGTSRRRTTPKPVIKQNAPEMPKIDSSVKRAPKRRSPPPVIKSPPKKPLVMETKTSIPFALNILPKKNDPVDVEKAFGRDSSFLPRPLTPPEPEDTISAEETEKAMAELEATSVQTAAPAKHPNTGFVNPLPQIITTGDKTFMPLTEQPSVTVLGTKTIPASIIKPILNTSTDAKKSIAVSVATSGFKTVFQQGKVLNPTTAAQLKNISGVNLIGGSLTQSSGMNSSKAMIAVPSNSATILVSSSALKAQPGKVLQLLSKGPISLKAKDPAATSVSSAIVGESSEQQVCNLSLLSDVAGMTEPLKDTSRKIEVNSPSATLVKLAVPDKSQQLKRLQVLKSLQTRVAPTRVETAEEVAEKQLAIQALNKSIGIESSASHVKESGYSICYAKPDGSIVSRAIPRPGQATYIRAGQSIIPHLSGRGRVRPILPNKMYRFCHK